MKTSIDARRFDRDVDRLLRRLLQLQDLVYRDAIFDPERAEYLKEQIRLKQAELEALYADWDLMQE